VPVSIVISKILYATVFYSLEGVLIKQKISPPAPLPLIKEGKKVRVQENPSPCPPSFSKGRGNKEKRSNAPLKYSNKGFIW